MVSNRQQPRWDVFISYSHNDRGYASKLADLLKNAGFSVWIDDRIKYGTQWPHDIQENLDASKTFILIMTPQAQESAWVLNELTYAQKIKKVIFPLLLAGDSAWFSVHATQFIDVRDGKLPSQIFINQLSTAVRNGKPHTISEKQLSNRKSITKSAKQPIPKIVEASSEDYFVFYKVNAKFIRGEGPYTHRTSGLFVDLVLILAIGIVGLVLATVIVPSKSALALFAALLIGSTASPLFKGLPDRIVQVRRHRRLARKGTILSGTVASINERKKKYEGDAYYILTLRFRFMTPLNRTIEGKEEGTFDKSRVGFPTKGTPVKVLYIDDETFTIL